MKSLKVFRASPFSGHRSAVVPLARRSRVLYCAVPGQQVAQENTTSSNVSNPELTLAASKKYNWKFDEGKASPRDDGRLIVDLPVAAIRRPLGRTRGNDQDKVAALMASIQEIGLQEPIDVLEVDGVYYGFSGCHRFEAHQKLGAETIRCRVRKANQAVLKMHMM